MKPAQNASPPQEAALLTLDQVAAILQISRRTVQRLIQAGELPALKLGHRTVRLPAGSVRRFIYG
jgi:excisionase family DNA binding protein